MISKIWEISQTMAYWLVMITLTFMFLMVFIIAFITLLKFFLKEIVIPIIPRRWFEEELSSKQEEGE